MSDNSPLAGNLRNLRAHFGYTLEQTAEGVGVTRQAIAKWESGQSVPDIAHADALAQFYNISLDDLIHHDTEKSGLGIPPKGKHLFGTVQVGERGQIVIPKSARDLFQLTKGTNLVVLGDEEGPLPGLALVKNDVFLNQATAYAHMGKGCPMTNDSLLTVSHLTKRYPQFTLQDVSFTIAPGTIMGMIGVNGAGKSTTLKSIAGLVQPDAGTMQIAAPANPAVMLGETVYYPEKKLATITRTTRQFYSQWDEEQYRYYLHFFDLDDQKKVKELSTGMLIKYQLAVTMSHHAPLLILDEPTSGIDPVSRDAIRQVFRHYVADGQHSILFSTHITTDLEAIADSITYIHAGAVLYSAAKPDFIDHFRRQFGLSVNATLTFDDIMLTIERKTIDDSAIPA